MSLPSLRGLSLDRLSSFLQIADAGGLARAAPGDPIRQSQLSRQLKDLESALEQPLFLRTGRGMDLTAAGASLARVIRELGQGLTDVAAAEQGPVRVALGAGDSVLQWLVLPRLGQLGPAVKGVELELGALGSDGVANALREHRTVTFDLEGKPHGDATLIEALRAEPYVPRTSDYAYRGSGVMDRALRTMGWLGLVGAVVLRARRSPCLILCR